MSAKPAFPEPPMRPIVPVLMLSLALAAPAAPASAARRVVVAIDGSGSMKDGVGSTTLSDALEGFVRKLQPDDELALIVFDDRAQLLRSPAPVGRSADSIVAQIGALQYTGQHSDVPDALALACDVFPATSGEDRIDVLLVTDGVVTVRAPRSAEAAIADMKARIVPRCAAAGVHVHVIGLGGEKVRTEVLQSLAEATDGRAEFPLGNERLAGFLDAYLESTAPPPPPPASAPESRTAAGSAPAGAPGTDAAPAEASAPSRGIMLLGIAAVLAALALLAALLAWRRRRAQDSVGASGFVTLRERKSGLDHALRLPATLGRSPSSPIQLDDKEVSRKHLRLEMIGTKVAAIDLGSSNGTFVNGIRLKEAEPRILKPGDRLVIPGVEFLVQPEGFDADSTYIRQDLDRTFVRPTTPDTPSR